MLCASWYCLVPTISIGSLWVYVYVCRQVSMKLRTSTCSIQADYTNCETLWVSCEHHDIPSCLSLYLVSLAVWFFLTTNYCETLRVYVYGLIIVCPFNNFMCMPVKMMLIVYMAWPLPMILSVWYIMPLSLPMLYGDRKGDLYAELHQSWYNIIMSRTSKFFFYGVPFVSKYMTGLTIVIVMGLIIIIVMGLIIIIVMGLIIIIVMGLTVAYKSPFLSP